MAIKFPRVQPGDLITADMWNAILAAIEDLDSRAGTVNDNKVAITSLIPPLSVEVGKELQIWGRNFGYSLGAQQLFFDNLEVTGFKGGSGDSELIIDVPTALNPPPGGKLVKITVSNRTSYDTSTITVLPATQVLFGTVAVVAGTAPTPVQNQNVDFPYTITSGANLTADFKVTPKITGPNWPDSAIKVLDANKVEKTDRTLSLVPNFPTQVFVRVSIPNNTTGTSFTLEVTATSGNVTGTSVPPAAYTVGQAPAPKDDTITLGSPTTDTTGALNGMTIQLASGKSAHYFLPATFSKVGTHTYDLSATFKGTAANWVDRWYVPTPISSTQPDKATLQVTVDATGAQARTLDFAVAPLPGASSDGTLEIKIQNQATDIPPTILNFTLKLL